MAREKKSFSEEEINYSINKVERYPIMIEVYWENGYKFDTWDGFRILAQGETEIEREKESIIPNCDSDTNWDLITAKSKTDAINELSTYKDVYY